MQTQMWIQTSRFPFAWGRVMETQHGSCPGAFFWYHRIIHLAGWTLVLNSIIWIKNELISLVNQLYHRADTNTLIVSQSANFAYVTWFSALTSRLLCAKPPAFHLCSTEARALLLHDGNSNQFSLWNKKWSICDITIPSASLMRLCKYFQRFFFYWMCIISRLTCSCLFHARVYLCAEFSCILQSFRFVARIFFFTLFPLTLLLLIVYVLLFLSYSCL